MTEFRASGQENRVVVPHLAHPDVAKDARHFPSLHDGTIPPHWPLRVFANAQGMHTADDADHRRLRSLVGKAFTARQVERVRPRVEELTTELLDDLERAAAQSPDGTADLRTHFALPLPMSVICELLGVTPEHRGRLHHLSNTLIIATDTAPAEVMAAVRELVELIGTIAATRRASPSPTLTSRSPRANSRTSAASSATVWRPCRSA